MTTDLQRAIAYTNAMVSRLTQVMTENSGGAFNGTMDDIPDGTTYVKTENNLTDALVSTINDALPLTGGTLTGGLTITAATDAVNSSKITDKDGNTILSIDTVNNRVGIGIDSPATKLDLNGGDLDLSGTSGSGADAKIHGGSDSHATYINMYNSLSGGIDFYNLNGTAVSQLYGALNINGALSFTGNLGLGSRIITGSNDSSIKIYDALTGHMIFTPSNLSTFGRIRFNYGTSSLEAMRVDYTGKIGILTTAPDKQLEINSVDGNCLRLTYNDANGSATYYVDFNVSAAGLLTINASGGIINTANDIEITDTTKGIILKSPDGSRWRVTVDNSGNLITTSI